MILRGLCVPDSLLRAPDPNRIPSIAMLKIIGGEFRSRRLLSPEDGSVSRPYASRVKESVFNLLRGWWEGATVLDLFAGVGTIGLEAVSRGAAKVYMIERNRDVFRLLEQNIKALDCGLRATAIFGDALSPASLARVRGRVDLIFIDPPYEMMIDDARRGKVLQQIERCRPLMGDKGFLVLRSPVGVEQAELSLQGFVGPEQHRYAPDMHVLLYAPAGPAAASGSLEGDS